MQKPPALNILFCQLPFHMAMDGTGPLVLLEAYIQLISTGTPENPWDPLKFLGKDTRMFWS